MIKKLKITTISDNQVYKPGLWAQWGLSFLIEITDAKERERKILFDTSDHKTPWLYNVKKLELDLTDLDAIVLSHGHSDHTAATVEAVELCGGCPVYAHPHCFMPRYYEAKNGRRTRGGVPEGEGIEEIEAAGGKVVLSEKPVEIVPGLWTTGQIPRTNDFEKISPPQGGGRRIIIVDGEEKTDQILCDQALWAEVENKGIWVITGCAHSGPINTLNHIYKQSNHKEISAYIGGTHLIGREDTYIQKTIRKLKKYRLKLLSPCHCTGFNAMSTLYREFKPIFAVNYCGRVLKSWEKPAPMVL